MLGAVLTTPVQGFFWPVQKKSGRAVEEPSPWHHEARRFTRSRRGVTVKFDCGEARCFLLLFFCCLALLFGRAMCSCGVAGAAHFRRGRPPIRLVRRALRTTECSKGERGGGSIPPRGSSFESLPLHDSAGFFGSPFPCLRSDLLLPSSQAQRFPLCTRTQRSTGSTKSA